MIVVTLALAGALIALGVVQVRGSQYRATVSVRTPTADATCIVTRFNCPEAVPTAAGNPYVLDQVNAIKSLTLAAAVKRSLPGLESTSPEELRSHVSAKEIGASPTVDIGYVADNQQNAGLIAAKYAQQYVLWSNNEAIGSLKVLQRSLQSQWVDLKGQDNATEALNSARGTELNSQLQGVANAIILYQDANKNSNIRSNTPLSGPNGARIYDARVKVVGAQTLPGAPKTAAMGAVAGLVLGIGLILVLPSLGRRRDVRESLPIEAMPPGMVGAEVTQPIEPVR